MVWINARIQICIIHLRFWPFSDKRISGNIYPVLIPSLECVLVVHTKNGFAIILDLRMSPSNWTNATSFPMTSDKGYWRRKHTLTHSLSNPLSLKFFSILQSLKERGTRTSSNFSQTPFSLPFSQTSRSHLHAWSSQQAMTPQTTNRHRANSSQSHCATTVQANHYVAGTHTSQWAATTSSVMPKRQTSPRTQASRWDTIGLCTHNGRQATIGLRTQAATIGPCTQARRAPTVESCPTLAFFICTKGSHERERIEQEEISLLMTNV